MKLVNATYDLKDGHELTVEKLDSADSSTVRLVKKAEAYFRLLPGSYPTFSHFDPAMYLLGHPKLLETKTNANAATLARFEKAFQKINSFI